MSFSLLGLDISWLRSSQASCSFVFRTSYRKLAVSLALSLLCGTALAYTPELEQQLNERVLLIPAVSGIHNVELQTTIFSPPGEGPFPLVVMNHGKERGNPHRQKRDRFLNLSREFVKRGYAVMIPMRTGFAESTGTYADYGCDMGSNGQLQANDLQSVLEYASRQPWIDAERIVVAGQSYGGLATMAFGTRNFPGVRGLINFAGGLRIDGGNCHWRASLVHALADYGRRSKVPSLWFYGENDSYFGHEIAFKMHDAYVRAGGKASLIAYGSFKQDAHAMVGSRYGVQVWWPETEKFLQQIGMPTQQVLALDDGPALPPTDYAVLENVEAVPFLHESGRAGYRTFLTKSFPRAFAVAPNGVWSWAEEGDDPAQRVLANCEAASKQACQLYALDDYVVWNESAPVIADSEQATTLAEEARGSGTGIN